MKSPELDVKALPNVAEQKRQYENLQTHKENVTKAMFEVENEILDKPDLPIIALKKLFSDAKDLTDIWQYLSGIEYNRYIKPVEDAKKLAAQNGGKKIIASA